MTFAIIWLGSQLCLTLLGLRVIRTNDAAGLTKIIEQLACIANHIFIPSSLLTLISGVFMAWAAGLFGDVWVIVCEASPLRRFCGRRRVRDWSAHSDGECHVDGLGSFTFRHFKTAGSVICSV